MGSMGHSDVKKRMKYHRAELQIVLYALTHGKRYDTPGGHDRQET